MEHIDDVVSTKFEFRINIAKGKGQYFENDIAQDGYR